MHLTSAKDRKRLEQFIAAVANAGGVTLEPTNEWEVFRYRLDGKVGIIYKNKKGRVTPTGAAEGHMRNWKAGRELTVSKAAEKRIKRAAALQLYTDASFYASTGSGAWAAILVDDGTVVGEAHGPLKAELNSSSAAEAQAAANGLHHFMKAGHITRAVRIVLDNQPVVKRIQSGRTGRVADCYAEAIKHIKRISTDRVDVSAEWVKGHQKANSVDPRAPFNRRCDKLAGKHAKRLHLERKENDLNSQPTDAQQDQTS